MSDHIVILPLPGQSLSASGTEDDCPPLALPEFIVGPENRLVAAAVAIVLEGPASRCNPLIFHGPPGTGKSHLARGLAAALRARRGRQGVVETTASDFAQELADAIETNGTAEFRETYRKATVLVLEDIGRIAHKAAAQQELIATLDALLEADSRVIITASSPPGRLDPLEPALQSRLVGGLAVPLAIPSLDTRRELIRRLARMRKIALAEVACETLAASLPGTAPELHGALLQLSLQARLREAPIDADDVIALVVQRGGTKEIRVRDIAVATARHFSLRLTELRSPSRRRAVVTARGVAMFLARQLTPSSLEQVGRYFGGRDHTTVLHGCRKTESLLDTDPTVRQAVQTLQSHLRSSAETAKS